MENFLRMAIIFVWSMFFGFFSVLGFIDETMPSSRKAWILVGLLVALGVYLAFEWFTRKEDPGWGSEKILLENKKRKLSLKEQQRSQLDERVLRRLHLYTRDHEKELQAALQSEPPGKSKNPQLTGSNR